MGGRNKKKQALYTTYVYGRGMVPAESFPSAVASMLSQTCFVSNLESSVSSPVAAPLAMTWTVLAGGSLTKTVPRSSDTASPFAPTKRVDEATLQ